MSAAHLPDIAPEAPDEAAYRKRRCAESMSNRSQLAHFIRILDCRLGLPSSSTSEDIRTALVALLGSQAVRKLLSAEIYAPDGSDVREIDRARVLAAETSLAPAEIIHGLEGMVSCILEQSPQAWALYPEHMRRELVRHYGRRALNRFIACGLFDDNGLDLVQVAQAIVQAITMFHFEADSGPTTNILAQIKLARAEIKPRRIPPREQRGGLHVRCAYTQCYWDNHPASTYCRGCGRSQLVGVFAARTQERNFDPETGRQDTAP